MTCSLQCGCGKCENWIKFTPGDKLPKSKVVDVKYANGLEFLNKPIENCYFGPTTLITQYREK